MPYSPYNYLQGLSLGETAFTLKKEKVTSTYIDFILNAYGDKWQKIDIAFEYRFNDSDQWRTDAVIIGSQSAYIQNNMLLDIISSSNGSSSKFRWKYQDNNISDGMEIQLRLRLLPRTKNYSFFNNVTVISEAYGKSFFNFDGSTDKKCIGRDLYGRYICVGDTTVNIFESLTDSSPLYSYGGLNNPTFVKQIRSGSYIVAVHDNNLIVELDSTLDNILKSYAITGPIYFDFSEQNETLLVVSDGFSYVFEVTWSEMDNGNLIWQSGSIFSNPSCATYNSNNFDDIVVVDESNVYILDKYNNTYTLIDGYQFTNSVEARGSKVFWHPYRAYFYENDTICVIERDGEVVDFDIMYSSSTSSESENNISSSSSSSSSFSSFSSFSSSSSSS